MLIQPGLKKLLQSDALASPLLVEGTKVKSAIFLVIRPRAVVHEDAADIMQGIGQIEKLFLVKRPDLDNLALTGAAAR